MSGKTGTMAMVLLVPCTNTGLIGFADCLAACSVHAVEYDQIVFEKEEADFVSRAK